MTHAFYNFSSLFFRLFYYRGSLVDHLNDLNIKKNKGNANASIGADLLISTLSVSSLLHVYMYVLKLFYIWKVDYKNLIAYVIHFSMKPNEGNKIKVRQFPIDQWRTIDGLMFKAWEIIISGSNFTF